MVHSQEVGPTITAALDDGPLQGRRIETHAVEGRPPIGEARPGVRSPIGPGRPAR
jgi:hypothetical protein